MENDMMKKRLYVFRKGQKGWRVTMESFSWGLFQ
jgi:ketosteroid isomerase-like protein